MEAWFVLGVGCVVVLALAHAEALRRDAPAGIRSALIASTSAALLFALGDLAWRLTASSPSANWPSLLVMWAGLMALAPAWWVLSLRFAELHGVRPALARSPWAFLPAVLQVFFFGLLITNPWHGQFLTPAPDRSQLHAIGWAHNAITYSTLLGAIAVFGWLAFAARTPRGRRESRRVALGFAVPFAANVVYLALPTAPSVDPTMVALALSSGALVFWMTRHQLFALSPVEFSRVRALDSDAVLLFDGAGGLLDANPSSRALLGALLDDPDEALRRVEKSLQPLREGVAALWAGIPSPGEEFTLLTAVQRQLRITTLPLHDPRGETVALLLRARDETELAEAHAQARERAALLEAVFDAAGLAVIVIDRAGRLRFCNEHMSKLWGDSLEGEAGASAREILQRKPPADRQAVPKILELLERSSHQRDAVLREDFTLEDGRVIEVVSVPMREDGVVSGRLFLNADVTERRRHESAVHEAARLDDLSRLAGGVAHGFNNLLSAVLGNAELALMTPQNARTARYLNEVRAAADRGALLANQLLAYAGRAALWRVRVDVGGLIEREAGALARELPRGALLSLDVPTPLAPVAGDATQLAHALGVLLRNAAEALPPSGGTIAVAARDEGDEVVIRVRDDGHGMDAATLGRIFEPFFSTKPKAKGLGLAAARGIVAQHGGSLAAESAPGAGATFTLRLPRAGEEVQARPSAAATAPRTSASWRGAGRILVVDDELPTLSVSRELAETLGFEAVSADRPSAALAAWRAAEGAFRVALIDATMPECDGPELLRRLRSEAPGLPAVIYSGFTRESFELPSEPPTEFLQKPFSREALASALRRVLREDAA